LGTDDQPLLIHMVTFSCDLCADAVKKPKAIQHMMRCRATMTCVDCGKVFDSNSVNMHNSCVSEAEKYQGKLYAGPKHSEGGNAQGCGAPVASVDLSLVRGPPWVCKMCNVSCSGRDNLIAHHQSKKHVNKAKHLASGSSLPDASTASSAANRDAVPSGTLSCPDHAGAQSPRAEKETSVKVDQKDKALNKDKKEKKQKKQKKDKKDKKEKEAKKLKKKKGEELQGIAKPKIA
jgi:hypothetical protein